ncbi:hypothetical protein EFO15_10430 [Lactococcus lactis]|nr:hypothetical protein [Lactococcus lactis]
MGSRRIMERKIEKINTVGQAQKFSEEVIKEPKTYFLQGIWGSGKTEYLAEVENIIKNQKFKFIKLELWNPKNNSSLEKNLFSTIYPKFSWFMNGLGWILIIASVFGSIILSIRGLLPSAPTPTNIPLLVTTVAVILTTLYNSFFQNKWLEIDRILMWISLKSLRCKRKPKVLIIDDFDRLDEVTQKDLYILFNAAHKMTRVIFVGDLSKIKNIEDNYLGKIIDQKISLPFSLHSRYVVQSLYDAILKIVKENFNFSIINTLFTEEKRTARDANQFLSYVENEYITQKKLGKVQIDQHLFIVYIYLFHQDEYQKLLDGWLPKVKEESSVLGSTNDGEEQIDNNLTAVQKYMYEIFQPRATNPTDYRQNASAYLLNEFANNKSIIELKEIITSDGRKLREFFLVDDEKTLQSLSDYAEFLDFVNRMGDEEYDFSRKILEKNAILAMKTEIRHNPNKLINTIFNKRNDMISRTYWEAKRQRFTDSEVDSAVFEQFEQIFIDAELGLNITIPDTEKMYYYRTCLNLYGDIISYEHGSIMRSVPLINEQNVHKHFIEKAQKRENEEDFGINNYDAEVLIVQLGYHYWLDGPINPTKNPEFNSKIESIEKLSSEEYLGFWNAYDVKIAKDEKGELCLQGGTIFKFDYEGKSYEEHILNRLMNLET